jgi:long-chain fatty acid transport protein
MAPGRIIKPLIFITFCMAGASAEANALLRNGTGARMMGMGGADVGAADAPLGAMAANPAGLARLRLPSLEAGITLTGIDAEYHNAFNSGVDADEGPYFVSDLAYAQPLDGSPVTLGFSFSPISILEADWKYIDPPGGAGGASYGLQRHRSSFTALRMAAGAGVELGNRFAIGATVGAIYNDNALEAPYIFQSHPVLRGLKTLLDLEADGWGVNGTLGTLFRVSEDLQLGLSYTTPAAIEADGEANGDIGAQLAALGIAARPDFRYDAEVKTRIPQQLSGGLSWRTNPRLRIAAQIDWIDWDDSFNRLPVHLTNGNNADINALLGTSTIDDVVPLDWEDRIVYRAGGEYAVNDRLQLRAGYSYGRNPVPDATLTPLTAAIMEHTVSLGLGYRIGKYRLDFAYQWDIPNNEDIAAGQALVVEYAASSLDVGLHWLSISLTAAEPFK